jgi:signal peptidase I
MSETEDRPVTDPADGAPSEGEAQESQAAATPAEPPADEAEVSAFADGEPAPLPEAPANAEIAPAAAEVAQADEPVATAAPQPAPEPQHEPAAAAAPVEPAAHEPATGRDPDEPKAKDELIEIAKTIFYALLIAFVLRVFLFQPFTIPSASMEPNLYEGDYIIVSKWSYGYSKYSLSIGSFSPPLPHGRIFGSSPKRGDIVVFKLPRDNKTDYIKRVIGLPGDQIQMKDDLLYINGAPVKDVPTGKLKVNTPPGFPDTATAINETLPGGKTIKIQDFGPGNELDNTAVYTVPAGYYFMMGDNRDDSIDSRVPTEYGVGFVPAENLVGKAQVIMFSWYPGASLWKPWTWFTKVRPSRFFHGLQ